MSIYFKFNAVSVQYQYIHIYYALFISACLTVIFGNFCFCRPFYGYHENEQEFIKIQLYNPRIVAKYDKKSYMFIMLNFMFVMINVFQIAFSLGLLTCFIMVPFLIGFFNHMNPIFHTFSRY